jgi:hypothetical protein
MDWLRQVVLQSLIVGAAAAGVMWLPWLVAKVFLGIFLLWFVVSIGRNPLVFWRRLARLVIVATIPLTVVGVSFRLQGHGRLPSSSGNFEFLLEQTSDDALPIVILVLVCALAFDAMVFWRDSRVRQQIFPAEVSRVADLSVEPGGTLLVLHKLLLEARSEALTITGARLVVGPFAQIVDCDVFVGWSEVEGAALRPVTHEQPLEVPSKERARLVVEAEIEAGIKAGWLRSLTSSHLAWIGMAQGELRLIGLPAAIETPVPLRLRQVR